METRRAGALSPLQMGCLGAAITGFLASCLLLGLLVAPALDTELPSPPNSAGPGPDITVFVQEAYLDRMLTGALPGPLAEGATLDLRGDNRLVISASVDLVLGELDLFVTLSMFVEADQLQVSIDSIETGGRDILELLDLDLDALAGRMGSVLQRQVEAGLGQGARILALRMDDKQLIITARWP